MIRIAGMSIAAAVVSLTLGMWSDGVSGQQLRSAAQPRTADGRPDLSGYWQAINTAAWDIQDHVAQPGIPGGRGVVEGNEIPYQPWAAAKQAENRRNRLTADPESRCYLPGVPRATYMGFPFQIVQTPKHIAILYEYAHTSRLIYTDGSSHPRLPLELWMGDSRGRWDGDTLVVTVALFNGETWFDRAGNFHSEALRVTERYSLDGPDHITYEATIEDPKVFTRAWTMTMPLYRRKDKAFDLLEYECYVEALEGHNRSEQ